MSQPYSGRIVLDGIKATAPGLPHDRDVRLAAGVPVTVPVAITNTGVAPEQFFIDARLNGSVSLAVPLLYPPSAAPPFGCGTPAFTLPLGSTCGDVPTWLVPTQTSSIQVGASATLPVEFDFSAYPGDPDIPGVPTGPTTAAGSYTPGGGRVEQGLLWGASPSEFGPYQGPAATGSVSMSMTVTTRAFDPAVTTAQGDLWLGAISGLSVFDTFAPLTINPGATGIILVTITPDGPPGTVVSGTLYVNDYVGYLAPYGQTSGDELAAMPYAYTIQ